MTVTTAMTRGFVLAAMALVTVAAAAVKVDLSKEKPGGPPATFEPMVGTWLVAKDGGENVIMVDGRPWVTSKDNPTKLLIQSARKLYGTTNEELMDNAKQFAVMVQHGMRPMDAVRSATSKAAAAMGWEDRVGTVAPGRFGDLIAVSGDPLADIRTLEAVRVVVKGGRVVKPAR